jgi:glycosyltransferase involved in cell wall biosynthesis
MPGRRILILTHEFAPFHGGVGAVARGLAEGAAELGDEPIVLAPDYHADQRALDSELPFRVQRFPGAFCSMLSFDKLSHFAWQIRQAVRHVQPDIVHGVDPAAQMALYALRRLQQLRNFFFTVHGTEIPRYRSEPFPRIWMRGAFHRVTAIAVVSHAVRDLLAAAFPEAAARSFVAHPGIGRAWFDTPRHESSAVRAAWGAGTSDVVILTIARRVAEKGHDMVIAALASLPEEVRARVVYVIAGTGPDAYAAQLRAAAAQAHVRVHMTGALPETNLVAACDAGDILAMLSRETPKRIEGFGLAYLEAAARGLPCLARETGGVAEAMQADVTGILLPASAATDSVAAALLRLIGEPELRARMGAAGRAFASSFTWPGSAARVYDGFARAHTGFAD